MQKTTLFVLVFLFLSGCQKPEEPLGSISKSATVEEVGAELLRDELGNLEVDLAEASQLNAKLLLLTHPLRKAYNVFFVGTQPGPQSFIGVLVGLDADKNASYLHLIPNAAFRGIRCLSDALVPILPKEEEAELGFEAIDKDVHRFIPLVQGISRRTATIDALAARNAGSDPALLQLRAALAENYALQILVELEEPLNEAPTIVLRPGERKILVVQEILNLQLSKLAKAALQGGSKGGSQ